MTPSLALRHYFTAQSFLTRLPPPAWVGFDPNWVPASLAWFPAVGALIGAVSGAVYLAAAAVLTEPVAAVLAVLVTVLVTGALHEDALADTADGIGGGRDAEHALEIMRDSRVGSHGVVALILACLLRVSLLVALGVEAALASLILAHCLARASVYPLMTALPYLRESGAGAPFIGERPPLTLIVFAALVAIVVGVCGGIVAAVAAACVSALAMRFFRARLSGITGDGFGAVIVITEVVVMSVLVMQA